ncbi:probable phosphoglycerate mutase [Jatrophihabitans endophyticus]|uniref:Probable phosphoglycerate mutase n=1 Tax=Jatrophihabitans endophyticus TaxID=1206085 RepID=A0A1M5KC27_9ACTN|nr:histidine phosphatase family protein [Jatrophihabitans endophyticus]SHG50049.1 probable phosphoglycerate mutase [Jatrophihabitans endophyticus]
MTGRRLVLLRHGRTAWNAERRFQGHLDPPLDEVGRAQAYEVGALVAAMRPDLMVSSTLSRAVQTAGIVADVAGLPFTTDVRFRERGLGHWEGHTLDEVAAAYPEEYGEWAAGQDVERRGGETRDEVAHRSLAALAELPEVPLTVVVTHGATAMSTANALLGIAQRTHPLAPLANCHWTELVAEPVPAGRPPRWRVRGHNLGAPGAVVPLPTHPVSADGTTDADA